MPYCRPVPTLERAVKVVLFAGGRGLRMRDGGPVVPKPLSLVDGRPVLWHVMSSYAAQGHTDFVLCLGYRAAEVRDAVLALADDSWSVTCVDTGLDTLVAQRLVQVRRHVEEEPLFLANYADLLSDVPVADMVERVEQTGATASLLAVRPQASFHLVELQGTTVTGIGPVAQAPMWQNGGFFVMRPDVFDVIGADEELEEEPLQRLARTGRLLAHPWEGFWTPLDTPKDRERLEGLIAHGSYPWLPSDAEVTGAA